MFKTDIDKLKDAMDLSSKLFSNVKTTIVSELLTLKSEDIKPLSNNCFLINSSKISPISWSPEYYNTENQIRRVVKLIENSKDIFALKKIIDTCVLSGRVHSEGYEFRLNEKTISALKEVQKDLSIF